MGKMHYITKWILILENGTHHQFTIQVDDDHTLVTEAVEHYLSAKFPKLPKLQDELDKLESLPDEEYKTSKDVENLEGAIDAGDVLDVHREEAKNRLYMIHMPMLREPTDPKEYRVRVKETIEYEYTVLADSLEDAGYRAYLGEKTHINVIDYKRGVMK